MPIDSTEPIPIQQCHQFRRERRQYFLTALAQILTISLLGVVIAATVRLPACPATEPVHAWQR